MTRSKLIAFLAVLCLLAPTIAGAVPPGDGIQDLLPPPGYMKLSQEQREATRALAEDLKAALQPLREEEKGLREELGDELGGDDPDATTLGELMIQIKGVGAEIRAELRAFDEAFSDLLTAEQLTKWENFKELRRLANRMR